MDSSPWKKFLGVCLNVHAVSVTKQTCMMSPLQKSHNLINIFLHRIFPLVTPTKLCHQHLYHLVLYFVRVLRVQWVVVRVIPFATMYLTCRRWGVGRGVCMFIKNEVTRVALALHDVRWSSSFATTFSSNTKRAVASSTLCLHLLHVKSKPTHHHSLHLLSFSSSVAVTTPVSNQDRLLASASSP